MVAVMLAEAVPLLGGFLQRHGIGAASLREGGIRWWAKEWRDALVAGGAVDVFRTSKACRAIILEAGASAAGLTLTCAQHVVFVDVLGSAELEAQAKARVARIGQRALTTAWHLIATGTVEERLREAADADRALDHFAVGEILGS